MGKSSRESFNQVCFEYWKEQILRFSFSCDEDELVKYLFYLNLENKKLFLSYQNHHLLLFNPDTLWWQLHHYWKLLWLPSPVRFVTQSRLVLPLSPLFSSDWGSCNKNVSPVITVNKMQYPNGYGLQLKLTHLMNSFTQFDSTTLRLRFR